MPLPGPPAEKEPPPPIIMFSTAKGMKSASCREEGGVHRGHAGVHRAGGAGPAGREPVGLTRKEQLSSPIMMCVSSGNGAGPGLTLDMSLSSCNQQEQ